MAVFLFTGLPGHGKTLNAIRFVDTEFKDRPVYQSGIKELKLPWNDLDDPKFWFNVPDGSVVLIDECQRVFKPRQPGSTIPQYVSEFETHRHRGLDIVLITQHPNLIDAHVRRLIDTHHHLIRQFGMQASTQYTGTSGVFDPKNYHEKKDSIKKRISFDKKYFNVYKSAEIHTVKRRLPLKMFIPIFLVIFVGSLFAVFANSMHDRVQDAEPVQSDGLPDHTPGSAPTKERAPLSVQEYAQQLTPRFENLPFTAPAYDELRDVKAYPWPSCVASKLRGCTCYSQQASKLNIDQATCEGIVKNGLFDNAKPDADTSGQNIDVVAVHLKAAEIYASMTESSKRVVTSD